jgi:hypothetical protein
MRKFLLAAALVAVSATSVLAAAFGNPFYVVVDRATGQCSMMQLMGAAGPDTHRYHVMGAYNTMRQAHRAMVSMGGSCH